MHEEHPPREHSLFACPGGMLVPCTQVKRKEVTQFPAVGWLPAYLRSLKILVPQMHNQEKSRVNITVQRVLQLFTKLTQTTIFFFFFSSPSEGPEEIPTKAEKAGKTSYSHCSEVRIQHWIEHLVYFYVWVLMWIFRARFFHPVPSILGLI